MKSAVRAEACTRIAPPIALTTGALVAEIAFAVGRDEDWDAGRVRWRVPGRPNATELDVRNRNALRKRVDREHPHGHWSRPGKRYGVTNSASIVRLNFEDDLAAAVRDLSEVLVTRPFRLR